MITKHESKLQNNLIGEKQDFDNAESIDRPSEKKEINSYSNPGESKHGHQEEVAVSKEFVTKIIESLEKSVKNFKASYKQLQNSLFSFEFAIMREDLEDETKLSQLVTFLNCVSTHVVTIKNFSNAILSCDELASRLLSSNNIKELTKILGTRTKMTQILGECESETESFLNDFARMLVNFYVDSQELQALQKSHNLNSNGAEIYKIALDGYQAKLSIYKQIKEAVFGLPITSDFTIKLPGTSPISPAKEKTSSPSQQESFAGGTQGFFSATSSTTQRAGGSDLRSKKLLSIPTSFTNDSLKYELAKYETTFPGNYVKPESEDEADEADVQGSLPTQPVS